MNKTDFFNLVDIPTEAEIKSVGLIPGVRYSRLATNKKLEPARVMAKWTGEKRCPKKGEWYLSGSVIEAYKAKNDLAETRHIAKLVGTFTKTVIVEVGADIIMSFSNKKYYDDAGRHN